jgi:hypothetical protein
MLAILLAAPVWGTPSAAPAPLAVRPAAELILYQQGVAPNTDYSGASDTFISRMGDEISNYGGEPYLASSLMVYLPVIPLSRQS